MIVGAIVPLERLWEDWTRSTEPWIILSSSWAASPILRGGTRYENVKLSRPMVVFGCHGQECSRLACSRVLHLPHLNQPQPVEVPVSQPWALAILSVMPSLPLRNTLLQCLA